MAWRWTAQRLAISAFAIFHLAALSVWTMPDCAIKDRFNEPIRYYMLPTGLWQWWAIFAPYPLRENRVLEAEVVDAKKLIHIYEFTKLADSSQWHKLGRYRNPKFTDNIMAGGEYAKEREFTARHVVRQLRLEEDAFPLVVSLYAKVTDAPPEGVTVADTMTPPRIQMLERYEFGSLKEVCP